MQFLLPVPALLLFAPPDTRQKAGEMTALIRVIRNRMASERGDVPGWVLITLMTAGLVVVIWGLAGPALSNVFEQAIERVTSL